MLGHQSQKGSAHAIIIIILVLALAGSLGWIFWEQITKKSDIPKQGSSKQDKTTPNRAETIDQMSADHLKTYKGEYFSVNYPGNAEGNMCTFHEKACFAITRILPQDDDPNGEAQLNMMVTAYDGEYIQQEQAVGSKPNYIPVVDWYARQGKEHSVEEKDPLLNYAYKLTRYRGQTNNAEFYILNADRYLYQIRVTEGNNAQLVSVDKTGATYTFSPETKEILRSFLLLK